jgi:hypothetical protein
MKGMRVALVALALAVASSGSVHATGAIAVGKGKNPIASGIAVGLSTDYRSTKSAQGVALAQCKGSQAATPGARASCKVVKTFTKQCASIAFDARPGKAGFGWGLGATKWQANAAAVASCKASSKPGDAAFCKAVGGDCD